MAARDKIELRIAAITRGSNSTTYTLILAERTGNRRLPVVIGFNEAQAIAIVVENIMPPRPYTHDLFKTFAESYGVKMKQVIIYRLNEGIFYAMLYCDKDGVEEQIDARTSDAIALALRFNCPIYTYEEILKEAGISMDVFESPAEAEDDAEGDEEKVIPVEKPIEPVTSNAPISTRTLEELEHLLENAIEEENYILAARIRDELTKRKSN